MPIKPENAINTHAHGCHAHAHGCHAHALRAGMSSAQPCAWCHTQTRPREARGRGTRDV